MQLEGSSRRSKHEFIVGGAYPSAMGRGLTFSVYQVKGKGNKNNIRFKIFLHLY